MKQGDSIVTTRNTRTYRRIGILFRIQYGAETTSLHTPRDVCIRRYRFKLDIYERCTRVTQPRVVTRMFSILAINTVYQISNEHFIWYKHACSYTKQLYTVKFEPAVSSTVSLYTDYLSIDSTCKALLYPL